jgi:malonyl-CoA/methylmalonyl-CoA synthetase
MSANLYAVFRAHFPTDLNRSFILTSDGAQLSYGDVERSSAQFANALRALGVSPGDRVAVQVEKSAAAIMVYLACLRAGAIYLPLNTAYTGDELDYFLNDATPRLFICDPAHELDLSRRADRSTIVHRLTLDENGQGSAVTLASVQRDTFETAFSNPNDLAAILYSSGTTGRPKGAILSHGALATNANALHTAWQFGPDDVLLHALPIFHTHGLFVATNTVLMNGTSMIFHARFEPAAVISDLPRATVFMGVPTYYTRLLTDSALTTDACRTIRLFLSGSAPLLDETFRAFTKRTGHTIVERYGMTEAGIITSAKLDEPRQAGTVGWPLEGVSLRLTNEAEREVADGTTGNVQVKGNCLFSGYWNKPGKTADEFTADGYFRTGDIGRTNPDGQLMLVGRSKDMLISGGFNVFPKEIEQVIDAMDGVDECAVVGLPHPDFGEAGLVLVVMKKNVAFDADTMRGVLKNTLANYKVPKLILQAEALPRNAMGKVQKNVLREVYRLEWDKMLADRLKS